MPRIPRQLLKAYFYHIITQGINKEYIFNNEKYIKKYIELLYKKKIGTISIIAYCIMNNHSHLLIYSEKIEDLSLYMHNVNTAFAKYYNTEMERVGYVFRDRYKSESIDNISYLIKCINYIHNNPVKAGIVKTCDEYKYSSYKEFLTDRKIKKIEEIVNINLDKTCFVSPKENFDFMDTDIDIDKKIQSNIEKFLKNQHLKVLSIFENRKVLKNLIKFLKDECKINYIDIMKKLEIPKGVMNKLKI